MGKKAPDAMLDAALDYLAGADVLHICSAEPANYAGIAAVSLGSTSMAGGDFTKAAGDVSGRKVTVAAKSGISITTSGTANHIVLARAADSTLRFVTTCTSQAVTSGNTANTGSWKDEIAAAA